MTSSPPPEYRAIDPATYLDLARELAVRAAPESNDVALRSAADRAYYAVFLFSRDQLAMKGYVTPKNNARDHETVTESLQEILGTLGGDELHLRYARNQATYETSDRYGDGRVGHEYVKSLTWMLDAAQRIIDAVRSLPPAP